jgi:hypothetical protein
MSRPTLEIADIFRDHGPAWRSNYTDPVRGSRGVTMTTINVENLLTVRPNDIMAKEVLMIAVFAIIGVAMTLGLVIEFPMSAEQFAQFAG